MGIVRRHKRVTVSGKTVTVRQHTRYTDSGPDMNERRPAAEDAAPAPNAAALPPPELREDAETWWDDDEPRPEPWMDTGEDEPEHSPAFAAMLRQNPSLGDERYGKLRRLRESGYTGPIDQDGNPTDG